MKRKFALLMIFILVLSNFSFAAEMTAGQKLKELGLVQGDQQGYLNEDKTLTRAEMMVMLARLNGLEEEAKNFTSPASFEDIQGHWARNYIAFAKSLGWTKGKSESVFDPQSNVGEQEVATFMIRVLGYSDNWATAIEDAAKLGIVNDNKNEEFTRGNAFDMMYDAINTVKNGSNEALGVQLDVMDEDDVIKDDYSRPRLLSIRAEKNEDQRDVIILNFNEVMSSYSLNALNISKVLNTIAIDDNNRLPYVKEINLDGSDTQWSNLNRTLTIHLYGDIKFNTGEYVVIWFNDSSISDLDGNTISDIPKDDPMYSNWIY